MQIPRHQKSGTRDDITLLAVRISGDVEFEAADAIYLCVGVAGYAAGDKGAKARSFFFHAIEETPRPSKFSGKNTQCEQNREPARTRGEYQRDTQAEERESQHNFQDSLCGFDRPRKHLRPLALFSFCSTELRLTLVRCPTQTWMHPVAAK